MRRSSSPTAPRSSRELDGRDLHPAHGFLPLGEGGIRPAAEGHPHLPLRLLRAVGPGDPVGDAGDGGGFGDEFAAHGRSEEHTSELQSLMRISYAVFCLKKKKT